MHWYVEVRAERYLGRAGQVGGVSRSTLKVWLLGWLQANWGSPKGRAGWPAPSLNAQAICLGQLYVSGFGSDFSSDRRVGCLAAVAVVLKD